jgi:hypothetical protein
MLKSVETAVTEAPTADDGDVPNSVLGVGYDEDVLERELELEELAEAEMAEAGGDPTGEPELPALPGEEEAPAVVKEPGGARPPAPGWPAKVVRTFVFAALATFVTALPPVADQLANGSVDISVAGSLAVGAVAGAVAAGLRAVAALLPVFPDDDVGVRRSYS